MAYKEAYHRSDKCAKVKEAEHWSEELFTRAKKEKIKDEKGTLMKGVVLEVICISPIIDNSTNHLFFKVEYKYSKVLLKDKTEYLLMKKIM